MVLGNDLPLVDVWYLLLQELQLNWPPGAVALLVLISGAAAYQIGAKDVRRCNSKLPQRAVQKAFKLSEIRALQTSATATLATPNHPMVRSRVQLTSS